MPDEEKENKKFINLGVITNDKGEVLVIRRVEEETGTNGSVLRWAFPGGKQLLSESRSECVKREVLAETGYDIEPIREISLRVHPQFLIVIVYHLCRLASPKPVADPVEQHEVAEIKRVKREELPTLFTTDFDPQVKKELQI